MWKEKGEERKRRKQRVVKKRDQCGGREKRTPRRFLRAREISWWERDFLVRARDRERKSGMMEREEEDECSNEKLSPLCALER